MAEPGEKGLVSVIVPTFNRARTIRRAVQSILDQGYRNLEVLIMDDGSTDGTAEVVKSIDDPRVRYVVLTGNGGASRARNAGLKLARGEFIAFQDSDDEWLSGKLEQQVRAAEAAGPGPVTVFHPKILYGRDAQGVYGPYRACCLPSFDPSRPPDFKKEVHRLNPISTQALLINRAALQKIGPFDHRLVNNNDWAFAIDLIYNTEVVYLEDPLVMTYVQGDSISQIKRSGARSQLLIMRKLRRHGDFEPAVMGAHLGRIGWDLTKLGNPRWGRKALVRGLMFNPLNARNWARLGVTQWRILSGAGRRGKAATLPLQQKAKPA